MSLETPKTKAELIVSELKKIRELGELFSLGYLCAVTEYPKLINTDIEVSSPNKYAALQKTGGGAIHQSNTETGRPLVIVYGEAGEAHFKKLMETRKISTLMCAESLGISIERLTPKILALFIFLHELGHSYDFLINIPKAEDYKNKRTSEMQSLPIPGWNPANVILEFDSPDSLLSLWYHENKEKFQQRGYYSKIDLTEAQERAYHSLDSEKFPDNFSANLIKKYKENLLPELKF